MTGAQIKALAFTREKRVNQTSPATRLKVARKNARLKLRAIEKRFVLRQKSRTYTARVQ
jgi:hypothetical protein